MNKKIIAGIVAVICIISAGYFALNKNNTKKASDKVTQQTVKTDFKIKSAFADIDQDMIIQDKDPKDDYTSADFIFLSVTSDVVDNKKDDDSNPFNVKSYKLDGNALPKNSKVTAKSSKEIIIILPDGALKGINSPHSLEVSKNLLDKNGKKIQGDLSLKLPFSNSDSSSTDGNNNTTGGGSTVGNSKNEGNTSKDAKNKTESSTGQSNANMPKYTVELGKAIPQATVVLVRLDTKEPQNYKVTLEGNQLEHKKNAKVKIFL